MYSAMLLVRHGQEELACQADEDDGQGPSLSAVGRVQARLLADRLAQSPWRDAVRIYHSPRRRCVQTAHVLAQRLCLPCEPVGDLRSLDPDSSSIDPWDSEANEIGSIPPLVPHSPAVVGGETWARFVDRTGCELRAIFERHIAESVIVIAHSGTVAASMHALAGWPLAEASRFYADADNCSLTEWRHVPSPHRQADPGGQFVLKRLNVTDHLCLL
jgi:2,3-bisphosphoglycerate-dependent phosphoglycerate mutase